MSSHHDRRNRSAWPEVRAILARHRRPLALGFVLLVVSRVSAMVLPASSKLLIDDVVGRQRHELLTPLVLAVGIAALVQAGTSFALTRVLSVAAERVIMETRRALQRHVIRLPISAFDSSQTGVLVSRIMSDAEGIQHLIGGGFVTFVGAVLSAGIGVVVLLVLNWRLTVWTLLILTAFGAVMWHVLRRLRPFFRERSELQAQVVGRLAQALAGVRIVKASAAERREDLVFARGVHRLLRRTAQAKTASAALASLSTIVVGALAVLLLAVGGGDLVSGQMSVGELVTYTFFAAIVGTPLVQLALLGSQITEALAGLDRIRELRLRPVEELHAGGRPRLGTLHGHVTVERVSFEYVPGVPVLEDISLVAAPGTTTALVGPSGSGKSTLISLLMAFHRPTAGRILVDGHDLADVDLGSFRAQLGVVLQDGFLFDGTITANIRYANPRASDAEVRRAARLACCDEFIGSLAGGYAAVVGERGVRLSSGQRQRIAIARALLANPRLLLLDEATSSLDVRSELKVQEALRRLRAGRTTVVIAHRLSTIVDADQICVLDRGRIVERGTHASLYPLGGSYRKLCDAHADRLAGELAGNAASVR